MSQIYADRWTIIQGGWVDVAYTCPECGERMVVETHIDENELEDKFFTLREYCSACHEVLNVTADEGLLTN